MRPSIKNSKSRPSKSAIVGAERVLIAQARWEKSRKLCLIQQFIIVSKLDLELIAESRARGKYKTEIVTRRQSKSCFSFINPKTSLFITYKLIIALINLYLSFLIPFRIAFYRASFIPYYTVHDLILDGILFIELLSRFFIEYRTESKQILKPIVVFKTITTQVEFYTDLLSVIPLYLINYSYYWFKIGRILKVKDIIIWAKNKKSRLMKRITKTRYRRDMILKVAYFSLLLAITCHCIACFWYYITTVERSPVQSTWIGSYAESYSLVDNYMRSLYWTAVTFSSVGYGDITPKTLPEYIYTMCIEFIGIIFFAYLMGSLSNYLTKYHAKKEAVYIRENLLDKWLMQLENQRKDKTLPNALSEYIKSFFYNGWQRDPSSVYNYQDYFMRLPPDLADSLNRHLFGNRLVFFHAFFDHFPEEAALKLVTMLIPINYSDKDVIIRENLFSDKIYFIETGSVNVGKIETGCPIKLARGSYFGEDTAMFADKSLLTFISNGVSECLYLDYSKAFKLIKKFGLEIDSFAKIAFKRTQHFYKTWEKKYGDEKFDLGKLPKNLDLFNYELSIDDYEDFYERSRNMKPLNKPDKEKLDSKKATEYFNKLEDQVTEIQSKYNSELKQIIKFMGKVKSKKSLKKVIKKLN
jgi:Ion channel